MKGVVLLIFFLCCLGIPSHSLADCSPEKFLGPAPGYVHIYDNYSGGLTKVWGLSRNHSGVLTTLVEIAVPSEALPDVDFSKNGQGKSFMRRQYSVSGCQLLLKNKKGDHILLDVSKDEWTFKTNLLVAQIEGQENEYETKGECVEFFGRVLNRVVRFFQGKNREIIHVGYSFTNTKGERQSVGRLYFVEGLGCFLGELSEFTRQVKAKSHELEIVKQVGVGMGSY